MLVCVFCVWFFFLFFLFFFIFPFSSLCMLLLTLDLDWLDWTCFFIWSGVVVLPCGLPCPMHLSPFGVRQASVNCPLPMVKLLQTPRCYGDWRHLWVVPWTKLQQPWPAWEQKTHSTPAKPTSMYLAHTDTGTCQFTWTQFHTVINKLINWIMQCFSFLSHLSCTSSTFACVCMLLVGSDCVIVRRMCAHLSQWQ